MMIELQELEINSLEDYDKLINLISNELYINQKIITELKERIGDKCKTILIEYPYRDLDFSSTYSLFYSKKHKFIPKECYRLHFFKEKDIVNKENYEGYLTLRPSYISSKGRAHLSPDLLMDNLDKAYLMLVEFNANILGTQYAISSFPWMSQETDIAVCAHVACWSIVRYYSQKYEQYGEQRMDNIVQMTPKYLNRNIPSEGLNLLQISDILTKAGFHPLCISREKLGENRFLENIGVYIESGLPIIGVTEKHAISIIGHGDLNFDTKLLDHSYPFILSSYFINSLIAVDDNYLPYIKITKDNTGKHNFRPRDSTYEMQLIFGHIQLKNKLPQVTKYLRYSISWYILVVPNVQLSCNPLCFIDSPFDIRS